jgi:hypothetical protein
MGDLERAKDLGQQGHVMDLIFYLFPSDVIST